MIKAGTILYGKYLIEKKLNQGGTSVIYKAFHKTLKIAVVVKKLDNITSQAISYRHEVDILKRFHHPMLPGVYDVFRYGEDRYIVIDFINGQSLEELLNKKGNFSEESVIYLAYDLINVLSYIHEKRIVHSDIKPANIMICESGQLKLIDFGIATLTKNAKSLGRSWGFAAPEQQSKMTIDCRADIYGLGATLFYLLTGELASKNKIEHLLKLKKVSKGLAYIIQKCLHTNPQKRYQSVSEIHIDLLKIKKLSSSFIKRISYKIAFIFLYFIFGICTVLGILIDNKETALAYKQKIDFGLKFDQNEQSLQANKMYYEAIHIARKNATAYYLIANNLYKQEQYHEVVNFIESNLSKKYIRKKSLDYPNLISVLASSYSKLNDNKQAYINYKEALHYEKNNINMYYSFATASCRLNKYDDANKALIKALDLNPDAGLTNLLLGELAILSENYSDAKIKFKKAISTISDNNLKHKAYLQLADIYSIDPKEIDLEISVLAKAKQEFAGNNQQIFIERLADTYYRKAMKEQDLNYLIKASECFEQLIFSNMKEFHIYDNLCALYIQLAQYEKAIHILNKMKNLFGDNYHVLKRSCFLEIAKINDESHSKRNYQYLLETYDQAKKKYDDSNTIDDLEMGLLELKISEILATQN